MNKLDRLAENALTLALGGLRVPEWRRVLDEDGFRWWPHRVAQRVWVERAPDVDNEWPIRICAETRLLDHVSLTQSALDVLSALNRRSALTGLFADFKDRTLAYRTVLYLSEESLESKAQLLGSSFAFQPGRAESLAESKIRERLGGEFSFSTHPVLPNDRMGDPILNYALDEVKPAGQGPSRFDATDFKTLRQIDLSQWKEITISDRRFDASLEARGKRFARLSVTSEVENPELGSGALVLLQLDLDLARESASRAAALLNAREAEEWTGADLIGAWCADERDGRFTLTWVTFVPSILQRPGVLSLVVKGAMRRGHCSARWPETWLNGSDLTQSQAELLEDGRESRADTSLCFRLRKDIRELDEVINNPDGWRSLTGGELHEVTHAAIIRYGFVSDKSMIPGLQRLYGYFQSRAPLSERMELLGKIKPFVEAGEVSVNGLLPFLMADVSPAMIASAAIDFAHAHPLKDGDLLTGPKLLIEYYRSGLSRDPVALLAGLVQLGDRRVFRLLEPLRDGLDDEDIRKIARLCSGYAHVSAVDFYLDWLERTDDERHPTRFAYLCLAIDLIRERAVAVPGREEPEVNDVERIFPGPPPGKGPGVRYLARYSLKQFAGMIAPRLKALADKEHGEKLVPRVMGTWGLPYP